MTQARPLRLARTAALIAVPALAILLARFMTHSDWAAANATIAALLFAWIVIDTLCLATIVKDEERRPGLPAMLGAAAAGAVVVLGGAAEPVRERIFAMPSLLTALALTIAVACTVVSLRVMKAWREGGSLEEAICEVAPTPLARFVFLELRMMRLALFSWGAKADVPESAKGFAYHRYLTPMIVALIALQAIELAVVHVLLMLWSPIAAWIVFAPTLAGLLWFVAFAKSLRLMPVLVTETGVRVRAGAPVDLFVPFEAIAAVGESFDAETLKAKTTLDTTILSAPNTTLRLREPVAMQGLFGTRMVYRIALRLDEAEAFRSALAERVR